MADFYNICAKACTKSFLMLFNLIFLLSGIAIFAIGIWMEVSLHKYLDISTQSSGHASLVLIGIGVLIVIISCLACFCTAKGAPVLLYMYGGFLAIVFVMEFGVGISIFAYRSKIADGFDKGIAQAMENYQQNGDTAADLDFMQKTLHCCGNQNFSDWEALHKSVPPSCCREKTCDTNNPNLIYNEGCYKKVVDFLESNIGAIAGASVGIAFFPMIGVILACCLASVIKKANYEQMA